MSRFTETGNWVLFPKKPVCEVCHKEWAISFSLIPQSTDWDRTKWMFTGMCTADSELCYAELERFFASPGAVVDWIAHLSGENYFNPADFISMIDRFREATGSYNQPRGRFWVLSVRRPRRLFRDA